MIFSLTVTTPFTYASYLMAVFEASSYFGVVAVGLVTFAFNSEHSAFNLKREKFSPSPYIMSK